jgi:hypothetical protein
MSQMPAKKSVIRKMSTASFQFFLTNPLYSIHPNDRVTNMIGKINRIVYNLELSAFRRPLIP